MNWLKLLRLPNLFILVATIFIVVKCVLHPAIIHEGLVAALTMKEWYLLLFIVVCIGAGGYVYNDIVDQQSDNVNEKRGIVGHSITRKLALLYYIFLTIAPLPAVLSLGMELRSNFYVLGYFILVLIFWLYNQFLKRLPIIGNVTVALLCGFAVCLPYLVEYSTLQDLDNVQPELFTRVSLLIFSFAAFSFLANWIREMIKDIEDMQGDKKLGFSTLPLVVGLKGAMRFAIVVSLILLTGIVFFILFFPTNSLTMGILSICLVPALLFIIISMTRSDESTEFRKLSYFWKFYFLMGLVGLIVSAKNLL